MRWLGRRESSNVEDQRGSRTGLAVGGGLGTVLLLVVAMLFGADPRVVWLPRLAASGRADFGA